MLLDVLPHGRDADTFDMNEDATALSEDTIGVRDVAIGWDEDAKRPRVVAFVSREDAMG